MMASSVVISTFSTIGVEVKCDWRFEAEDSSGSLMSRKAGDPNRGKNS